MRILSIAPIILGSMGAIAPLFQCFKVIRTGKQGVKFRNGKVVENKVLKPELHPKWPIADNIKTVSVNEKTEVYDPQVVILHDNTQFEVKASVRFRIIDVIAALVEVEDIQTSLEHLCMTKVDEVLSKRTSKNRHNIAEALLESVKKDAEDWGVHFISFRLVDWHAVGSTDKIMSMEPKAVASAKGVKVFLKALFSSK